MNHVFLSYARPDQARAEALKQTLESLGHEVWMDHDIEAGSDFGIAIEQALDQASCVVVLWSEHSIKSRWVLDESGEALDRKRLVPVLIDDVKPPLGFRRIEAAKLTGWAGAHDDPEFRILLEAIDRYAGEPNASAGVAGTDGMTQMPPPEPISEPEQLQPPTDRVDHGAAVGNEALRGRSVRLLYSPSRKSEATAAYQVLGAVGATVHLLPMGPGVHDVHWGRVYYTGAREAAHAAAGLLEHVEELRPTHLADACTDDDLVLCMVEQVPLGAGTGAEAAKGIRGVRVRVAHAKELTDHAMEAAAILKGSGAIATLKSLGRSQEGNRGTVHYARDARSAQAIAAALGAFGSFRVERLDYGTDIDVLVWLIAAEL